MQNVSFGENPYGYSNYFSNNLNLNKMSNNNLFAANNPTSPPNSLFANTTEPSKTK